jgi:Uma2 family endonuclease
MDAMIARTRTKPIVYPSSDGKPMAETEAHGLAMQDLIARLKWRYEPQPDAHAAGNLLCYWEEGNNKRSLAPDAFVAFGVGKEPRETFLTWVEGTFPAVVFEITSKTTRHEDVRKKLPIYRDIWKVREYFLFDPRWEYLNPPLQGYRLEGGLYVPIEAVNGGLESQVLGLTIYRNRHKLKLIDTTSGKEQLTEYEELAQQAEEQRLLAEKLLAEAELQKLMAVRKYSEAEQAKQKIELEKQQIEKQAERQAVEIEQLKAELARLRAGS